LKTTELIKRCQKKDPIAQELLYTKFSNQLFRTAYRYLKNQAEAEDVLITALNTIFEKIVHFEAKEEYSLEAWMKKIVVNQALMCLRKNHNFSLTSDFTETTNTISLNLTEFSDGEEIYKIIGELPTGYRTVFNLNVVEGYSHVEIAEKLDINVGTSRSQLHKAKELLKKKLEKEGYHYGT
jgi:RNA polymerase sigma-70 factor (ECF subfamily)